MKFQAEVIKKYLYGKFSLNDKSTVDEYFSRSEYDAELNDVLGQHWNDLEKTKSANKKDMVPLLDKINNAILFRSGKPTSTLRKIGQWYAKAAAVLLVPVLLGMLYFYWEQDLRSSSSWVEVHSPYGARTQFTLPDGSTGWLNSGSVIRYAAQFRSERTVELNGEAYFDVVKKPHSPFLVHTSSMQVKVLGTSFNVTSYDADTIAEVIVTSGKVQVNFSRENTSCNLSPNERLVYNKRTSQQTLTMVKAPDFTSWRTGRLVFANENLEEVVRKISRFYNVGFTIDPSVDRSQSFRAIVEKENLEEVLHYMKLTMSIDFTIDEKKTDGEQITARKEITVTKPK